jgi:hypothetical protein
VTRCSNHFIQKTYVVHLFFDDHIDPVSSGDFGDHLSQAQGETDEVLFSPVGQP